MAKTLLNLRQDTIRALGEAEDTTIGAVDKGDGTGLLFTNTATINEYLNDGLDEIARTAYLMIRTGTKTVSIGDRNILLSAITTFTVAGARSMRRVWEAYYTPTALPLYTLEFFKWEYFRVLVPGYAISANGTPQYWYFPHGDLLNTLAVEPPPSVAGTLTVVGAALPTRLAADGDTLTWLSDDFARAAVCYAAMRLCSKGLDDPLNQARYQAFMDEYNDLRVQIRSEQDAGLAKLYLDPLPTPNVGKATKRRTADAPTVGDGEA